MKLNEKFSKRGEVQFGLTLELLLLFVLREQDRECPMAKADLPWDGYEANLSRQCLDTLIQIQLQRRN